jgi:hypothetical protein
MGDRQGEKPLGFAISEKSRIPDDQIRKHQHHEKEAEDEKKNPLGEQGADERKLMQVIETGVKEPIAQAEVTEDESGEHQKEQRALTSNAAQTCTQGTPLDPEEKTKESVRGQDGKGRMSFHGSEKNRRRPHSYAAMRRPAT